MTAFENLFTVLTSPIFIIFFIIIIGYYIGKIQIRGISLDLAGVLIIAILSGAVLSAAFPESAILTDAFQENIKFLSSLGTSLFVSTIGISSGYTLSSCTKLICLKYFLMGITVVITGFLTFVVIGLIDKETDSSLLLGILCGAMTSTPGLSAVHDLEGVTPALATAGYGSAYLFGVVGVVLFVQFLMKKQDENCRTETKKGSQSNATKAELYGLIQLAVVIVSGCIVGKLEIPQIKFSLGNSGGILCFGILWGYIPSKKLCRNIPSCTLDLIRSLGLLFFFVGSGLPAGNNLLSVLHVNYIGYGFLITFISMTCGYLISRFVCRYDNIKSLSIVCGGMTSTPAIGVLMRKNKSRVDITAYSIAYVGALFAMVVVVRLFPLIKAIQNFV